MADQNFIKGHEFLDEDFDDVFKQDDIEPDYQNIDHPQQVGINSYGHNEVYYGRPKNISIVENIHMQQAHKTHMNCSDDEDQDDNYRVIKNMTNYYQTQMDQDHAEDQYNAQNDNQENDIQDDIKYSIIDQSHVGKTIDVSGSAETMINKYQVHNQSNSGFNANTQTKDLQNGNSLPQTKGKIIMGQSMVACNSGASIEQNTPHSNQQLPLQVQQKHIQQSQQLQGNKQGFKAINKEKSNLLSSSLIQPKSMTNIDSQQIGGQNNDYRGNQIQNNNLLNSVNNGISLDNSGILLNSINSGFGLRNHAQSMSIQENGTFIGKIDFKNNSGYLGSSLIQHHDEQNIQQHKFQQQEQQFNQENQQFQQEDKQFQQKDKQFQNQEKQFQQEEQQQTFQQQDNQILNKIKSEDCSSTNEQPTTYNQIKNNNSIGSNNNFGSNQNFGSSNNFGSANQSVNQTATTNHLSSPQQNNHSGQIQNKQIKGSNVSTEIKKPIKKVDVVKRANNQSLIGQLHGQQQIQQQILGGPPQAHSQQLHPSQFQQNFMNQIPNQLNYPPNPNQPPTNPQQHPQQQVGYGYPYSQTPQGQPQPPYGQQPPPQGFLPSHYQNPHLSTQYNQFIDKKAPHQQNMLTQASLQNPYSQEFYDPYGALLPPPTVAPQAPPPPIQAQNPGYGDYIQSKFNGLQYNAFNSGYSQHPPNPQVHQNTVSAAAAAVAQQNHHQNLQFLQHLPQINQPNGFNQGYPLNIRQGGTNIQGNSHELNPQAPFNQQQTPQNQIPSFKIKEEAQVKNGDDKNSSSSSQNHNINNNYKNGNLISSHGLNNSNQLNKTLSGQTSNQNQSNLLNQNNLNNSNNIQSGNGIQNQFNMIVGPNQYGQMILPQQGQQLMSSDQLHQANNALKLSQQNQPFLSGQLNQFNSQHQQQQYLQQQQNQFIQQQQQQLKQVRNMTNKNIEEESRDGEEDEDDNANSDGGDQEGIQSGKPKRPKNETKNIPKNYAKAFLRYIIDKERIDEMKKILKQLDANLEYDDIKKEAKSFKKNMNAIKDVRKIWQDDTNDRTRSISKFMRIASHQFLQKEAISYIFSSNKIKNSKSHIIYRHVMGLAMADPEKFNNIKSLYKNAYQD